MTYELAKELRDAGWYFEPFTREHQALGIDPIEFPSNRDDGAPDCRVAPTLEELLEACGENLAGLMAPDWKGQLGKDWEALRNGVTGTAVCVSGATPTEAVARLWLALNMK